MTFKPTAEQLAIIEAARDTEENLAVVARAGAAKTSTLVMVAEALPGLEILCLAFNKSIATEMAERLPPNCEAKTLHSLGFKCWLQFIRKAPKLDSRKVYESLTSIIRGLEQEERDEAYELLSETLDFIRQAKSCGYLPERYKGHWKHLVSDEDFYSGLPMEPTKLQRELIDAVLIDSFKQALEGRVDFDDMIYCPALCSVSWPTFDLTLVDEAQDLSPLNHYIIRKIVKRKRIIAVGDPLQAIYGFRGASTRSMQELIQLFSMKELRLTVTFRCGSAIAENVHWLAPDLTTPPTASLGEVHRLQTWNPSMLQLGDAIICRNNAPLFAMAIKMIKAGLAPELAGRDLAKPLMKILGKLGKDSTPTDKAFAALESWKAKELKRARDGAEGRIHDQAACIDCILQQTKTVADAKAYLQHILNRDGRIYLMTGHKSKGLEFNRVWFLDQFLCRIKYEQDANLKYVIETRAKSFLAYVDSETFTDE